MVVILSTSVCLEREKAGHIFWQALHSEHKEGVWYLESLTVYLLSWFWCWKRLSLLKYRRHFWQHRYLRIPHPFCSIKILSVLEKVHPHSSLKSQITLYSHIISHSTPTCTPSLPSFVFFFSLILIWMCFIFFSQGPAAPLRSCTLDAPWQMSTTSLFSQPCILYV